MFACPMTVLAQLVYQNVFYTEIAIRGQKRNTISNIATKYKA